MTVAPASASAAATARPAAVAAPATSATRSASCAEFAAPIRAIRAATDRSGCRRGRRRDRPRGHRVLEAGRGAEFLAHRPQGLDVLDFDAEVVKAFFVISALLDDRDVEIAVG